MAVLHSYVCLAHGEFEGWEARCPKGCNTVRKIFTKAPGVTSDRTRTTDRLTRQLAADHGYTDLNNDGGRGSVWASTRGQSRPGGQGLVRPEDGGPWFAKQTDNKARRGVLGFEGIMKADQDSRVPALHKALKGTVSKNTKIAGSCDKSGNIVRQ